MSLSLKEYKWPLLCAVGFAVLVAVFSFGYSTGREHANAKCVARLADQKSQLSTQCLLSQITTEKTDDTYQAGLSARDAALADAMREPSCIIINPESTGKPDAANKPNQPRVRNGINSNVFYRFAGECEIDRLKVIGLQQSIRDIYKALGQ